MSLRIPKEKEERIKKAAARAGQTKTAYILEALDEKLGIIEDREIAVRELSGWLSHDEAQELRRTLEVFNRVGEEDWN
jgi:predicted DNA-binding protein